jgi:MIP family channel proteins
MGARRAEPEFAVRLGAEAIGTFALTFVAAGGDVTANLTGGDVTPLARALAPGLLVMAFIYAIGDRSGAHFNPAVTLAFALRRVFPAAWVAAYWLAQLAGATLAAGLLRFLFGDVADAGVSAPNIAPETALALEIVLTAILVTVILGTADRYQLIGPSAGIAVGATIALCGLIALPIEGASMNPARSFGPALVSGTWTDFWVYLVGPALGATLGAPAYQFVRGAPPRPVVLGDDVAAPVSDLVGARAT